MKILNNKNEIEIIIKNILKEKCDFIFEFFNKKTNNSNENYIYLFHHFYKKFKKNKYNYEENINLDNLYFLLLKKENLKDLPNTFKFINDKNYYEIKKINFFLFFYLIHFFLTKNNNEIYTKILDNTYNKFIDFINNKNYKIIFKKLIKGEIIDENNNYNKALIGFDENFICIIDNKNKKLNILYSKNYEKNKINIIGNRAVYFKNPDLLFKFRSKQIFLDFIKNLDNFNFLFQKNLKNYQINFLLFLKNKLIN